MQVKQTTLPLIAWSIYDFANSAFSAIIETFILPAYFVKYVALNESSGTAAWGWTLALSGLFIAIGGPILGAIADQSGRTKTYLGGFTLLLVISTMLLWFVKPDPSSIPLALGLFALSTIASEFAYIFYNALLPNLSPPERIGRWSGWGWACGYLGGIFALIITLYGFINPETSPFTFDPLSKEAVRASFLLVGVWNIIFTLPLFLLTPNTPVKKSIQESIKAGINQLKTSFKKIGQYKNFVRFFIARMLFIDGLITLFAFGGIFAAKTFGMDESQVILFAITLNLTAGIGAALFAFLDDSWGSLKVLKICLVALIFLGAAALSAKSVMGFWITGAILGLFVGPCQASSRSYLAKEGPKEMITEMFGFFTLSGKATAFLGPFLVATLLTLSGSFRIALSVIILFFLAALLILKPLKDIDNFI